MRCQHDKSAGSEGLDADNVDEEKCKKERVVVAVAVIVRDFCHCHW